MASNEVIMKMENIQKSFSGVYALKSGALELRKGEVHALMGENGAGKSTLMKVLCGIHKPDSGKITYFGQEVQFPGIAASKKAGISIIHQELNMMNHLTVAQNIYIGREPKKGIMIDDGKMISDAGKLFEIAKAVSQECKLLILDEPTAALTQPEVEELFKIMNDLRQKGIGMIYISHRMDEINRISDRVTVMRDGEYIGTVNTDETTKDEIVHMMVGRAIFSEKKEKSNVPPNAPIALEVKNLNRGKDVKNVSFRLRKGEILGFAGLMGAGRTEVVRAIYGADIKDSGEIYVNGRQVDIRTPEDAVNCGICYLSEDRKHYGLLLDKSVAENSVLASLNNYVKGGFIDDAQIDRDSQKMKETLRTKATSVKQKLKNLSGGNQQKVIIARWLLKDSDIFIFDEPTRGIDVGAKSEIYDLMENLVKKGKAIIMISSELAEIQRLSDRVIVMCEGNITAELDIKDATQEEIMKYATLRRETR